MPSYKVVYFDARGRAEILRLLLTYAKQPFEDTRVTGESWQEYKPKTPFGQLPVLEIDGQVFAQTTALASYLAREFSLYGKTSLDALAIDQVVGVIGDFLNVTVKMVWEKDEARKAELEKKFAEEDVPKYMGSLESLLKKNDTGYFAGKEVTLADITVYDFVWGLDNRMAGTVDKFPLVKAHFDKIGSIPHIKAYVEARKPTSF